VSGLVVDASAMVAIIGGEPGAEWLAAELAVAEERLMAAPTVVELGIVLEARKPGSVGIGQRALREAQVSTEPFDTELADRALQAWRRFGKGRHRAALDLGDCYTYALAERLGHPILCTGDDFARTDLDVRRPPRS
jgi:ribonuclease VapC